MFWAIELEVDFQRWIELVDGSDTEWERKRWLQMCHRLGSHAAIEIVNSNRLRAWRMQTTY